MPFPKLTIHPQMVARIATVANGAMLDRCMIHDPVEGAPVLDEATMTISALSAGLVYEGRCRVQPVANNGDRSQQVGGREVLPRRYAVQVPRDAEIRTDAVVTITASLDGSLVGRQLYVTEVLVSSLEVERDLMCSEFPLQAAR